MAAEKVAGSYFSRYASQVLEDIDHDGTTRAVTHYKPTKIRAFVLPPDEYYRLKALDEKYGAGATQAA